MTNLQVLADCTVANESRASRSRWTADFRKPRQLAVTVPLRPDGPGPGLAGAGRGGVRAGAEPVRRRLAPAAAPHLLPCFLYFPAGART